MTKAELEKQIEELKNELDKEKLRPQYHIEGCHIDMSKVDEKAIAIANAVEEGMKALQSISNADSYGIYINN